MQELIVEAKVENLDQVNDFINHSISEIDCSKKAMMQLGVIVEEIFVNIASYAYPNAIGFATVQLEVKTNPPSITLVFIDSGIQNNPLSRKDPNLNVSVDEREVGGLGIYLVKNMVEEISYKYADGQNILSLTKNLN